MPDFKFEIGEGQIQNAIAIAITESFSPEKRDSIIRDVIRGHLSVKKNSYDKDTLLSAIVGEHVRKYAIEAIEKQLESMKPRIEQIVKDTLGQGFEESVFTQLKQGLARRKVEGITVSVEVEDDDY